MRLATLAICFILFVFSSAGLAQTSAHGNANYLRVEVRGTLRKGDTPMIKYFVESLDSVFPTRFKVNIVLSRTEDGNRSLTKWLEDNVGKEVIAIGIVDTRRFSCDPFTIYARIGVSGSKVSLAPPEDTKIKP